MAAIYFTKSQIEEIQQRLAVLGSKDSQLPKYATPLTGEEIFAIVQNGANKKIPLSDVMKMVSDNIVIVDTKEGWRDNGSYVPKKGQIIVYSNYDIYTKDGETYDVPAVKIGDGTVPVSSLPFVNQTILEQLIAHMQTISIHVSPEDREWWETHMDAEYVNNNTLNLYYRDREGNVILTL